MATAAQAVDVCTYTVSSAFGRGCPLYSGASVCISADSTTGRCDAALDCSARLQTVPFCRARLAPKSGPQAQCPAGSRRLVGFSCFAPKRPTPSPTPTPLPPPTVAVLSAFPAELAAVLEHVTVTETVMVEGRVFRKGTLAGVPVIAAMTGIGLLNAAATTQVLLDHFDVDGVIVSGVAGSSLQIGDVTVPTAWELADGSSYACAPDWLALARQIAAPGIAELEQCTRVTAPPTKDPVCFPRAPLISVGGVGHSADPFGSTPFHCQPNGGDVFGCDVAAPAGLGAAAYDVYGPHEAATAEPEPPIAEDMETAAIARETTARGLKFLGFRAVSDGAGDPLGLPGFPTQFFAYYKLAAHNAAAAVAAFLERVAAE